MMEGYDQRVVLPTRPEQHAGVFDLDGVVTRTAAVHAAAWAQMFDEFLRAWSDRTGDPQLPFDEDDDYRQYVDGKPRYDGVQSFLQSRGIQLPWGETEDPPGRETVCGLGNRKNVLFRARLDRDGPEVFASTVELVQAMKRRGWKVAVVSSSKNCGRILAAAGLGDLFPVQVDGNDLARLGLPGKPAPHMFLEAAQRIGVPPEECIVVEDSAAGVEAGRRGGFSLTVGVDRTGKADRLRRHGAAVVVRDMAQVELTGS